MQREILNAPSSAHADLVGNAEVTVTPAEAWSGLFATVSMALVAVAASGSALWLHAASV